MLVKNPFQLEFLLEEKHSQILFFIVFFSPAINKLVQSSL